MARVHYVDATALATSGNYGNEDEAVSLQQKLGLVQGAPFLLDDAGKPVRYANRWLQALPTRGASSPLTWKVYAQDFLEWHDFLRERHSDPLSATRDDLAAYHALRRLGEGGRPLAPASWNRKVAALDSFYQWALEEELIDRIPFSYRFARFATSDGRTVGVRRNLAKEQDGRPHANLKWLEADQLQFFLDVGMSGLLPSGEEDPAFRGRQTARNRAFAELLATAGLRAQEASHLLTWEIPEAPAESVRFVRLELPGGICKGKRGRWVLVPPQTLRLLHDYGRLERISVIEHSSWRPSRALEVTATDGDGGRVAGTRRKWKTLAPVERRRLVFPDGGSPLLSLTSTGSPMTNWEQVFIEATARCRRFQPNFPNVTPHTLRHTFAVHMLRWLIEQVAGAVKRKVDEGGPEQWAGYWRVHDPLLTLRDLLGHASVQTTQIYLHAIDATRLYAQVMDELEDVEAVW